jgi:5,5'-dehydrodivanillate O-demethylase
VLRGDLRTTDIPADRPDLANIQDYIAQVGQGPIRDIEHERLGRSDRGVILMRALWARELEAFAEGRPLTSWQYSDDLPVTVE